MSLRHDSSGRLMATDRRSRGTAPVRLMLTRRTLEDPVHGQCGVCFETRRLQQLVVLGADELALCRDCFEAAARFGRLGRGQPILFDLEYLP
jgi:hypothetical protein